MARGKLRMGFEVKKWCKEAFKQLKSMQAGTCCNPMVK
jgi:hypothetical protein